MTKVVKMVSVPTGDAHKNLCLERGYLEKYQLYIWSVAMEISDFISSI